MRVAPELALVGRVTHPGRIADLDPPPASAFRGSAMRKSRRCRLHSGGSKGEKMLVPLETEHAVARADADETCVGRDPHQRRIEVHPRLGIPARIEGGFERQAVMADRDRGDLMSGRSRRARGSKLMRGSKVEFSRSLPYSCTDSQTRNSLPASESQGRDRTRRLEPLRVARFERRTGVRRGMWTSAQRSAVARMLYSRHEPHEELSTARLPQWRAASAP
jgi:hypothetical protein